MKLAATIPLAFNFPQASTYSFGQYPDQYYIVHRQSQPRSQPRAQKYLLNKAQYLQAYAETLLRDRFDPFELNSFFYEEPLLMRRNTNRLTDILQSLDDTSGMIITNNNLSVRNDIVESPENFDISINIPEGMEAKDITLELIRNDEVLHLSGTHKVEKDNIVSQSKISRMFKLGDNADKSNISAKMFDGVLKVTVPKVKVEEVKASRKIEIVQDALPKAEKEETNTKVSEGEVSEEKESVNQEIDKKSYALKDHYEQDIEITED